MTIKGCILYLAVLFSIQGETKEVLSERKHPTIAIFAFRHEKMTPWDKDNIEKGLTGSEEAIVYISDELVKLGYKVTIFNDPPQDSKYSSAQANPRFVPMNFRDGTVYDIGIVWRILELTEFVKNQACTLYFWPHDTYCVQNDRNLKEIKDVLWLSKWQREEWVAHNPKFAQYTHIFGNGICPYQVQKIQKRINPYSCIYGSNYARGLEVLLDLWPEVKKHYPRATLDVYYGWEHWGCLTKEQERILRGKVESAASLGVKDHGQVGHKELMAAYGKASLWTYPCIAPETFCITAIRAQAAGAIPVVIEGSGLKETVRWGFVSANKEQYLQALLQAMKEAETISLKQRKQTSQLILNEYSWSKIACDWDLLFKR